MLITNTIFLIFRHFFLYSFHRCGAIFELLFDIPTTRFRGQGFFLSHLVIFHNFAVISLPPTFHLFLNLFLYYFIPVFFYLFFFLSYLLLLSFFIPFSFFPVFFFFSNCCCSLQISYNPDASYCYTRVLIKEYHLFRV